MEQNKNTKGDVILANRTSLLSVIAKTNTGVVSNWSGIQSIAASDQILKIQSIEQLSSLLKKVHAATNEWHSLFSEGKTTIQKKPQFRVVGAGMSYEKISSVNNISDKTRIVVDMCNFNGLIKMTENTATFGAATSVNDVISILGDHDRMLDCSPGVIGYQTVTGAISTGTHGQGMNQSCYADTLVSVDAVLPDGRIVHVDRKGSSDPTIPPLGVLASLGTLGVITAVELTHSPRRIFICRKFLCSYEHFLEKYDEWNSQFEFVKAWWFPMTDKVHVWFLSDANDEEKEYYKTHSDNGTHPVDVDMETETSLNDTVGQYLNALYADTGVTLADSETHKHSLTLQRFADSKDSIGYLEQLVCKGIPVPQINCEIAVPMSRFAETTSLLHEWAKSNPQRLHYPFIYRSTGKAERACIYPSYGKNEGVAYIGFLVYLATDGSVRDDGMATMDALQCLLATKCKGLPHMGKHFIPEVYDFSQENSPGMVEIAIWRKKLDPHGFLLNEFLDRLFFQIDVCNPHPAL